MQKVSFLQKFTACFVASFILTAIFLVLGRSLPGIIPELVFGLAGLSLLFGLIYPFIWQRKEKKRPESSLIELAFWQSVIRYGLAFNISIFGFKKIFGQQFIVPYFMYDEKLGSLSGEWLTWHYFGFSYPFGLIVASFQIIGSILLLFRQTRLMGVMLLLPVMLNILFINLFYGLNAGATLQSVLLSLGLVYLLLIDYQRLVAFFLQSKDHLPSLNWGGLGVKNSIRFLMIIVPFLITFNYYYQEDMPKNIRGTYTVEAQQEAASGSKDPLLTKIYFDRYGNCTFLYVDAKKQDGKYTYNGATNELKVVFNSTEESKDTLLAKVTPLAQNNQLKIRGTIGSSQIDLNLSKLK